MSWIAKKDIEIAAERLVKDNGWSKLQALSALHSKYLSERRKEESVIVSSLIKKEKSKAKIEPDTGFHDDM